MKNLYVCRPLLNHEDVKKWARDVGIKSIVMDTHVTICFSKEELEWPEPKTTKIISTILPRTLEKLGEAQVLRFNSDILTNRFNYFLECGASYDFDEYKPHITISYKDIENFENLKPYEGKLIFGPEQFYELDPKFIK